MQIYSLAALLAIANAAANAEADPAPCLWLKKKLGLCGGGSYNGGGSNNNGGGRATMIVYTTVTPAAQTVSVTVPGAASTVTTTVQGGASCNQGQNGGNGAVCGNDNKYTVETTVHHTTTSTVTQDVLTTVPCPPVTETVKKEVCAATITVCK